jgi:ubiquinone/menaquinone biosynthesis C-methylase UbiE
MDQVATRNVRGFFIEEVNMDEKDELGIRWAFLRRTPTFLNWFDAPAILKRIKPYIKPGDFVADLGCGWGYFTFLLADMVGEAGRVYAVDLGDKCRKVINRKAQKRGYSQIHAVTSTAANLSFISDQSIDFIFANGLLCSMKSGRQEAVSEMKRILKPTGYAYISLGSGPTLGFVDENEWEELKTKFNLLLGGDFKNMWAVFSQLPA